MELQQALVMPTKRTGFDIKRVERFVFEDKTATNPATLTVTMASGNTFAITGKEAKLVFDALRDMSLAMYPDTSNEPAPQPAVMAQP